MCVTLDLRNSNENKKKKIVGNLISLHENFELKLSTQQFNFNQKIFEMETHEFCL
jgi:hypothetical protein